MEGQGRREMSFLGCGEESCYGATTGKRPDDTGENARLGGLGRREGDERGEDWTSLE